MHTKFSKVSVVIATFNNAQYIKQAIDSALNQTYPVHEIIIINDGSTDNTKEVLLEYGDRIIYLETDRKGPAYARNAGIKASTGDLVAFLDSDDYWILDKNERQVDIFNNDNEVGLVFGKLINFDNKNPDNRQIVPDKIYSGFVFDKLLVEGFIGLPSVMIKKDLINTIGMFNENLLTAEDTHFYLRASKKYKFHAIEQPLVYRRLHGGNISDRFDIKVGTIDCLDDIANQYPENNRKIYLPMKLAYENRGKRLLADAFNYGQYRACNYYSRELIKRNVLPGYALFMYMLTLLPESVIDTLRKIRRLK